MYRTAMWSRRTCMGWSNGRGNRGAWAAGNCPLGHRGAHSARDDLSSGLPSVASAHVPCAKRGLDASHRTAPDCALGVRVARRGLGTSQHRTAPHHARGDEGGGDARRVVPLLAEIWSIRRPPAMLAGGSSAFGPLGLLHAAHSSLSLPRVVKAGVGVGAGRGSGRRCGCGRRGSGDNDGWVAGGRRLGEWGCVCGGGGGGGCIVAERSVPQRRRPKHSSARAREKCRGQPTGCSPSTARPPRRESASRRALAGHGEQRRRPPTLLDPGQAPLHH
ncbi:hypothetical protein J3E74DRAFT_290341 [Bipolaris maydis]|nr:hypothetical protein J3E74DRAFT_290341 [Bipolaris maydis]